METILEAITKNQLSMERCVMQMEQRVCSKFFGLQELADQRLDGGLRTRLSTIEDEIGQMRRDVKVCVVHIKLTNMPVKILPTHINFCSNYIMHIPTKIQQ
jgi:hypothetical protein